jgi:aryl-alcohol dehydrogenase-like predicted oxidoreductase
MKLTRKNFIKTALIGIFGITFVPKLFSRVSRRNSAPELRKLGNTEMMVTPIGFGTPRTQEPEVLQKAIDQGVNFLDTGRAYANGQNEIMIGKVIKGKRENFVIQSKMKVDTDNGKATSEEIRNQMETSLKESLKALQTNYIDVMLLHGISEEAVIQSQAIRTVFSDMKRRGDIRACGFSSHSNHVNMLKEANKDHFFDVIMVPFNPFGAFKHSKSDWSTSWNQDALVSEMKTAHKNGTGIVAMKTCSGGPYAFDDEEKSSYSGAVKWVLSHEFVDTTAIAMANFSQIKEHLSG